MAAGITARTDLNTPADFKVTDTVARAAAGCVVIEVNVHGEKNGESDEYYQRLAKGKLRDYRTYGRDSRETGYLLGMYRRVWRAAPFPMVQPGWDGRVLVAYGGSQGAAQATFLAAMDRLGAALVAVSPAMCDHGGILAGCAPG